MSAIEDSASVNLPASEVNPPRPEVNSPAPEVHVNPQTPEINPPLPKVNSPALEVNPPAPEINPPPPKVKSPAPEFKSDLQRKTEEDFMPIALSLAKSIVDNYVQFCDRNRQYNRGDIFGSLPAQMRRVLQAIAFGPDLNDIEYPHSTDGPFSLMANKLRGLVIDTFKITPEQFAKRYPGTHSDAFYYHLYQVASSGFSWPTACAVIHRVYRTRVAVKQLTNHDPPSAYTQIDSTDVEKAHDRMRDRREKQLGGDQNSQDRDS